MLYQVTDICSLRQNLVLSRCFRCMVSLFDRMMRVFMDNNGGYIGLDDKAIEGKVTELVKGKS